ncbi:MAG: hypothetical protein CMM50_04985 [Rhodospirillaceae bacterium]|nr:hypothetical protein [Rhodospirillaceae bacterium]
MEARIAEAAGLDVREVTRRLQPLRRDLVSDGIDDAFAILQEYAPFRLHTFESGSPVWTWRIPEKWQCEEAYVETLDGRRVIDAAVNPLHVASYSAPVDKVVSRAELEEHLFTHPRIDDEPAFIFYYYDRNWAFSCGRDLREALTEDAYRVVVRSRFEKGRMKVAEQRLPGETDEWIVLDAHICHPLQVNDGLIGVMTGLAVMNALARRPKRRFGYIQLVTPENIGATAWLSRNEDMIPRIKGGICTEMTGLPQAPALQLSYRGDTEVDRVFRHVHLQAEPDAWAIPYRGLIGNDERQFNAPGVRIPMLSYARALPWGHPDRPFRQYHSARDDLDLVDWDAFDRSVETILEMLDALEANVFPVNRFKGEPFLSGYDLALDRNKHLLAFRERLRILDCIDGSLSIVDIAERLEADFWTVKAFVDALAEVGLVEIATEPRPAR